MPSFLQTILVLNLSKFQGVFKRKYVSSEVFLCRFVEILNSKIQLILACVAGTRKGKGKGKARALPSIRARFESA